MSQPATLRFRFWDASQLTDAESVVLSDPDGTYGLRREDTGQVIIPAGTPMQRGGAGVYSLAYDRSANSPYAWFVAVRYKGLTQHFQFRFTSPPGPADAGLATEDVTVVEPDAPSRDGCPILRRTRAFVVDEGVPTTLRFGFRDRYGNAVSLAPAGLLAGVSDSLVSESLEGGGRSLTPIVKFREFVAGTSVRAPEVRTVSGVIGDVAGGVVDVALPSQVYGQSGIYQAAFGLVRGGKLASVQTALLSVERTLFGFNSPGRVRTEGPPTLNEVRMQAWDSDPADNPLLGDVEFSDAQLLTALARPIQEFNESNPPLHQRFDSRNFPWKAAWISATIGYLHQFAANFYRRNNLNITAGGKQLNYLDRERQYMQAGGTMVAEWKDWMLRKKVELNSLGAVGYLGSEYGNWGR